MTKDEALKQRLGMAQPVSHAVIAGALFDFMGLSLDDAKVLDWHTTPPQRPWVGLTDEEKQLAYYKVDSWRECIEFIEAALKKKNT